MTDIKNHFKYVASTGAQVTKQITKVSTVVAQQEKHSAKVASRGFKRKNVLATKVARKVNKEITETKKAT